MNTHDMYGWVGWVLIGSVGRLGEFASGAPPTDPRRNQRLTGGVDTGPPVRVPNPVGSVLSLIEI